MPPPPYHGRPDLALKRQLTCGKGDPHAVCGLAKEFISSYPPRGGNTDDLFENILTAVTHAVRYHVRRTTKATPEVWDQFLAHLVNFCDSDRWIHPHQQTERWRRRSKMASVVISHLVDVGTVHHITEFRKLFPRRDYSLCRSRHGSANTCLHLAAQKGRKDVVVLCLHELLEDQEQQRQGLACDPTQEFHPFNMLGQFGYTPLMLAVRGGHTDIVELLMRHGADPSLNKGLHHNALSVAAKHHRHDLVRYLSQSVDTSATINATGNCTTAAHVAVANGNTFALNFLLDADHSVLTVVAQDLSMLFDRAARQPSSRMLSILLCHTGQYDYFAAQFADIGARWRNTFDPCHVVQYWLGGE